jgi:hypothetical protein
MSGRNTVSKFIGAVALLAALLVHGANPPLIQARAFGDLAAPEPLTLSGEHRTVRHGNMTSPAVSSQDPEDQAPWSACGSNAIWEFSGHVLRQVEPDPMPAPPGVVVGLFGSHQPAQLEQLLAITQSDGNGFFLLTCPCSPGEEPLPSLPFLILAVTDEGYRVLGAWSHSGGVVVEGLRLQWQAPPAAVYGNNDFWVEPAGPPPGTRLLLPLVLKAKPSPVTATPTATRTPGVTPTASRTPTVTPTTGLTPTATPTPTAIPTTGLTPTATPSPSATYTPTSTPIEGATPTATPSPSATCTPTSTPTEGATPTATPSPSATSQATYTPTGTPTEGPTPTATPTSVPGAVLLDDNFDDGDLTGWTSSGGTWTNPGTYMRGEHSTKACNMHEASGADVIYEGTVTLLTGGIAGLSVRSSTDGSTGYDLVLDFSGSKVELREQPEGTGIAMGISPPLELDLAYQLKIVASGETLSGYLNGTKRVSTDDSTYTTGRLGVIVDGASATFDDLKATVP